MSRVLMSRCQVLTVSNAAIVEFDDVKMSNVKFCQIQEWHILNNVYVERIDPPMSRGSLKMPDDDDGT